MNKMKILESLRVYVAYKHYCQRKYAREDFNGKFSMFREFLRDIEKVPAMGIIDGIECSTDNLLALDDIEGVSKEEYVEIVDSVFAGRRGTGGISPDVGVSENWYQNYINHYTEKNSEQGESLKRQVDAIWNRLDAMVRKDHPDRVNENVECIAGLMNPEAQDRACGLVVGCVQSGKTRNYAGLALKAFTEGWNTVIVLTSDNTSLARQTYNRLRDDFVSYGKLNPQWLSNFGRINANGDESLNWTRDTPWTDDGKYFGLAQKDDDHLSWIKDWLDGLGDRVKKMRLLVIDDEADSATPDSMAGHTIDLSINEVRGLCSRWLARQDSPAIEWLRDVTDAVTHLDDEQWDGEGNNNARDIFTSMIGNHGIVHDLMRDIDVANNDRSIFDLCFDEVNARYWGILGFNRQVPDPNAPNCNVLVGNLVKAYFEQRARRNIITPCKKVFAAIMRCLFTVEIKRSKINRMLCEILSRRKIGGFRYEYSNVGYIGYTATPMANIVNEMNADNPLAADFAFSMEVSNRYFGFEKIFGESRSEEDDELRLDIAEKITSSDEKILAAINNLNDGETLPLNNDLQMTDENSGDTLCWKSMKNAIAWLFCSAAVRKLNWDALPDDVRNAEIRNGSTDDRWTTMFINIDHRIFIHRWLQTKLYECLKQLKGDDDGAQSFRNVFMNRCQRVWKHQIQKLTPSKFRKECPDYCTNENDWRRIAYPKWDEVKNVIESYFLANLSSGAMSPDESFDLGRVHVISVNSYRSQAGESEAFDGKRNMYKYTHPNDRECHIWILCGGNTISRGLTLPGLTVSYFARVGDQTPIDTITQMGRWFGYREGYELLPRLWVKRDDVVEFKKMCHIEKEMHASIKRGFELGQSLKNSEHQLELLSYGRQLSSRAAAYEISDFGFNQVADTFKTLSPNADSRNAMLRTTCTFLNGLRRDLVPSDDPRRSRYVEGLLRYPYYKNVSIGQMLGYLRKLVDGESGIYPVGDARNAVQSLIDEIDRNQNSSWDVVINDPDTDITFGDEMENCCPLLDRVHLASRDVLSCGGERGIAFGRMSNTDFRGNFARIDKCYLAQAESDLIRKKISVGGAKFCPQYPNRNSVLEHLDEVRRAGNDGWIDEKLREYYGVSRMTGEAYRDAVFSLPENQSHVPIMQITLVRVSNELLRVHDDDKTPFVVLSFYWPNHSIGGYFRGRAGVSSIEQVDDYTLAKEISDIVNERMFVAKERLWREISRNKGEAVSRRCFNASLEYGNMGFRVFKNEPDGPLVARRMRDIDDDICYSIAWCPNESEFPMRYTDEIIERRRRNRQ